MSDFYLPNSKAQDSGVFQFHNLERVSPLDLVVVIPVFNESAIITQVVQEWHHFLEELGQLENFRILLVNDGSTDSTSLALAQLAGKFPHIIVIEQENLGHGAAIIRGYKEALAMKADWIFQVDSDRQFLPSDFRLIWDLREQGHFLLGQRNARNDPWFRLCLSAVNRICLHILFDVKIPDSNIPYRLIQSAFLRAMLDYIPENCLAPNIFLSLAASLHGERLFNVPVQHLPRSTGKVSLPGLKLINFSINHWGQLLKFALGYASLSTGRRRKVLGHGHSPR